MVKEINERYLADFIDIQGEIDVDAGYGFITPYILVYGTLRVGQKMYQEMKLDVHTHHHGTYRIRNWALMKAKYPHAVPVDDPESTVVVDLLEIRPNRNAVQPKSEKNREVQILHEINFLLDLYEGTTHEDSSYRSAIVPIEVDKGADVIYAKMYFSDPVDGQLIDTGDFVEQTKFVKYNFLNV